MSKSKKLLVIVGYVGLFFWSAVQPIQASQQLALTETRPCQMLPAESSKKHRQLSFDRSNAEKRQTQAQAAALLIILARSVR